MFKLTEKIKFYVPSTGENNSTIGLDAHEHRASVIARLFSRFFGGATIIDARGFWLDDDHLIEESIKQVISFASSDDLDEHYNQVIILAIAQCDKWNQASIEIEINDDVLLIDAYDTID